MAKKIKPIAASSAWMIFFAFERRTRLRRNAILPLSSISKQDTSALLKGSIKGRQKNHWTGEFYRQ